MRYLVAILLVTLVNCIGEPQPDCHPWANGLEAPGLPIGVMWDGRLDSVAAEAVAMVNDAAGEPIFVASGAPDVMLYIDDDLDGSVASSFSVVLTRGQVIDSVDIYFSEPSADDVNAVVRVLFGSALGVDGVVSTRCIAPALLILSDET